MSGRDDVEACAIRVMLADDHRATLCGIAVMLDAPFTVDWLRRMERPGLPHVRHGEQDGEDGAARGMRRRSSAAERDDARAADTMMAQGEIDTVGASASATSASPPSGAGMPRLSHLPIGLPAGQSARPAPLLPSSTVTLGSTLPLPASTQTGVAAVPSSRLAARSIAVWHPTPDAFAAPRRAGAGRRGAATRAVDDEDDDERVDARPGAPIDADHAEGATSCGALGRTRVRDGIPVVEKEGARNGACHATIENARDSGGGVSSLDDRTLGNVVVTGAFSRSAALFDALATTPCDVLVCDLAMGDGPHGDGLTMIGYLRRHYPCVKLIVHTMCLHACVLRNLQLLRVPGIVSKMDDLGLIRRAVGVVHKGGVYHGPSIAAALAQAGYQDADADRPAIWSKREAEVIRRFVNGDPVKDIAQALNRSVKTVSTQKMSAMHKAGINSNAELYQYAAANGLLLMPGASGNDAWQWCERDAASPATNASPMGAGIAALPDASLPVSTVEPAAIGR